MTRVCDLSDDLVREIFARIPITSVRAVRSTCKLWESLSKNWILGKSVAARQKFLGFMTLDSKICSLRFGFHKGKDKDVVDISIKQVELLDKEISEVFHCDGLLLCVIKYNSRLLVWNPYLGQTRCIGPRINFHPLDKYALGYDNNSKRNHKILRFLNDYDGHEEKLVFGYEIYDFSSDSWRVLDVIPDWDIDYYQRGVSLKGNTYIFVREKIDEERKCFLLCFDFTSEKFGPRLPLPFNSVVETVALSCVREEQLAVLYLPLDLPETVMEIWVTTDIKPNTLSWSKFLSVDVPPIIDFQFLNEFHIYTQYVSFCIDEEEKVAVVFDEVGLLSHTSYTAFTIGDDGYCKSVCLREAPDDASWLYPKYSPPLVCSSYLPSLVQIKQSRKRKHLDD